MALEISYLSTQKINRLLSENYKLSVDIIDKLQIGTANCFKIIADNRPYFLKEFQSTFTAEDVAREVALVNFLKKKQFPVAAIIKNTADEYFFKHEGRCVYLQEFVAGNCYKNNTFPDNFLIQAAELLGTLHTLLKDYELKREMDTDWCKSFDPRKSIDSLEQLLERTDNCCPENRERINNDLIYRISLQPKIQRYGDYFSSITYKSTHGDYHSLQLICGDKKINAVVDFSSACCLPVSWEIMRSYVQSATECVNADHIDINKLSAYVKKYMQHSKLTYNDLKYMPFIYYYQLGRSMYGYKEYLTTQSENNKSLINFAFWRTNMCRYLEKIVDVLSNELIHLL